MIVPISTVFEREGHKGALFIGSVMCLLKTDILKQNHIGAVLTCSVQTLASGSKADQIRKNLSSMNIAHKYVPASDIETYDISQHFTEAIQFVRFHRNGGKNVVVHCHAGRSRSASLVLAYMMDDLSMDLFSAYRHLKEKRSEIQPNPGFWKQLQKFDKQRRATRQPLQQKRLMTTSCLFFNDKTFDPKRLSSGLYQKRISQRPRITKSFCIDATLGNEQNEPENPKYGLSLKDPEERSFIKERQTRKPTPQNRRPTPQILKSIPSFKKSQPIKQLQGQQINLIKNKIRKFIEKRSILA